jgi:hypothetical protein
VEEKFPPVPSDRGPLELEPGTEQLCRMIVESKIKDGWFIPENFLKEIVDLEAIVVVNNRAGSRNPKDSGSKR